MGSGDDKVRLTALARSSNVHEHVEFLGAVPDEELTTLYRDCAFFALPSKKEGFGLVFLEAMARSRAVVACDAGGIPEVVVPNATGLLVAFGDDTRLAWAFDRLWRDPTMAARMGREGLLRVDHRFRYSHYADRVGIALDRIMEANRNGPRVRSG